jgi:hypothetical protein
VGAEDSHQSIGPLVGKRLEEDGIDHAEHRGVGSDGEPEGRDHGQREAPVFSERSESRSEILLQAG